MAVEFAAVVSPFLLLLVGTLEISLILFGGAVLDGATREAARQIRVGTTQQLADPLATFKTELCEALIYVRCESVLFDVRRFSNFAAVTVPPLYDAEGKPQPTAFEPGDSSEIVVVRAAFRWPYRTPMMATAFGKADQEIGTTIVFRNEPFRLGS